MKKFFIRFDPFFSFGSDHTPVGLWWEYSKGTEFSILDIWICLYFWKPIKITYYIYHEKQD